jgi:hypothetical protein
MSSKTTYTKAGNASLLSISLAPLRAFAVLSNDLS